MILDSDRAHRILRREVAKLNLDPDQRRQLEAKYTVLQSLETRHGPRRRRGSRYSYLSGIISGYDCDLGASRRNIVNFADG